MQLTIVIILCIFVILCMWFVQYRPDPQFDTETREGFINFKKLKRQIVNQVNKQINNIKATKGGALLKLIPPVVTAKLATIVPQIKKEEQRVDRILREMKEKDKKKREERERKERERQERERKEKERKRVEEVTKIINKLLVLAQKYPDSKYDIQAIVNGNDMNNFIHGKNIISALQTYVNGPFTDPEHVLLLVKKLRESMALTIIPYA